MKLLSPEKPKTLSQKKKSTAPTVPLNFLLGCSQADLSSFELARMSAVANLRSELHETLDKIIDEMTQAGLAAWFRTTDRETLTRALKTSEESIAEILAWAKERVKNRGKSEEEIKEGLIPMRTLPPGAKHLSAQMRYTKRNLAEGKCRVCPQPVAPKSKTLCKTHLAYARDKAKEYYDKAKGVDELIPRAILPPGSAHIAASLRYQKRNLAEGKCIVCPKPLARNSLQFCEEHLAKARIKARQKKGLSDPGSREYLYSGDVPESKHGHQPGTLASLAMSREKKTRALLAELGIPPDSAAVSLKAAVEALQKLMPRSKSDAMTQAELFEKALIPGETTGKKALRQLLAAGQIQRIGRGVGGDLYRYFGGQVG